MSKVEPIIEPVKQPELGFELRADSAGNVFRVYPDGRVELDHAKSRPDKNR